MIEMYNTYARPVRDLRNNYTEIAALANSGNQVIITNNGREEVVVIGKEEYKSYEAFLHREYIKNELAKSKEKAKDPNTKWLSEDEFWTGLDIDSVETNTTADGKI
jgi:prevent-host-death family protein